MKIFTKNKKTVKKFFSIKRNMFLCIIALFQVLMICVSTGYAWIEATFATEVSSNNLKTQTELYTTANINMYYPTNDSQFSTSSDNRNPINLNDYIEEFIDYTTNASDRFMFAECTSANGKDFFFQSMGTRDSASATSNATYREGDINDMNTNYLAFDFNMSATQATKLWFDNASIPSFKIDGDECPAVRMAFCIDGEDPIIFTNNNNSANSYGPAPSQTTSITSLNSDGTKNATAVQQSHKFSEYTFNPETAGEDTNLHIGKPLISLAKGQEKKITVKIWLEQNDTDAFSGGNNPYAGRKLNINLKFCSSWNKTVFITVKDKTFDKTVNGGSGGNWLGENGAKLWARLPDYGNGAGDWREFSGNSGTYTLNMWVGIADNLSIIRWNSKILNDFRPYAGTFGGERGSNTTFYIFAYNYGIWGKEGTKEQVEANQATFYMRTVDVYFTTGMKNDASDDVWKDILNSPSTNDRWAFRIDGLTGNGQALIDMKSVDNVHYRVNIPSFIYKGSVLRTSAQHNDEYYGNWGSTYQTWSDWSDSGRTVKQGDDRVIWLGGMSDTGTMGWYHSLSQEATEITLTCESSMSSWFDSDPQSAQFIAHEASTGSNGTGIMYMMTKSATNIWKANMHTRAYESNPLTGEVNVSKEIGPTNVGFRRYYPSNNWEFTNFWNNNTLRAPTNATWFTATNGGDVTNNTSGNGYWSVYTPPVTTTTPATTIEDSNRYVYLDVGYWQSEWDSSNAKAGAYFFDGDTPVHVLPVSRTGNIFKFEIPQGGHKQVIFVRTNPALNWLTDGWSARWNQTDDKQIIVGGTFYVWDGTQNNVTTQALKGDWG